MGRRRESHGAVEIDQLLPLLPRDEAVRREPPDRRPGPPSRQPLPEPPHLPRPGLLHLPHDYTLFGDAKAKLQGLRHVYVHYLGELPAKIALYEPYNNRECLHCHPGARGFEENEFHIEIRAELVANTTSCLECHDAVHAVAKLAELPKWEPPNERSRPPPALARRLRRAGILLVVGLLVEAATLAWAHPTAFLAFAGLGATLVVTGVALYLHAIVSYR